MKLVRVYTNMVYDGARTWGTVFLAGPRGTTIFAAWFAVVLGVNASMGLGARHGAPIAPFGPVPVNHRTIVSQRAPDRGKASLGQAEGIDSFKTTKWQRGGGAPLLWNRAMQIIGVRLCRP